jgi:DNA-binding CsgD family transcriptional regulator
MTNQATPRTPRRTLFGGLKGANIPAGLVDNNAEIFSDVDGSLKGTYRGRIYTFNNLPKTVYNYLSKLYNETDSKTKDALRNYFNCKNYNEELKQWLYCNFGGFDHVPDFNEQGEPVKEYWECGKREHCPYRGIVCQPECMKGKGLSLREEEIIKCIARGFTDQETADELNITLNTARTHERNIRKKLDMNHRTEIAIWAHQNNLV